MKAMYKVIQGEVTVAAFAFFSEAWAFARVDQKVYSLIVGHDGVWIVNPAYDPSKPIVN